MAENRDFDYAVCKVPRKDKNGNDVTGDKIGKGGRHRSDGTYSAPVTDIQIVDEDPMQKPKVIVKREIIETTPIIDLPFISPGFCETGAKISASNTSYILKYADFVRKRKYFGPSQGPF